ncbi:MAG TPA: cupin domain-containing protein [Candidatus Polarisedimenticolia bacterium]|nr:cupin domain-containing protein [Candidatus Polarisedimenticolia bacterium]
MPSEARIVNVEQVPWEEESHGDRYRMRRRHMGLAAGSRRLGLSLYELPPGGCSWPYHYHLANEEAILVLRGKGTLRLAGRTLEVRAGDYIVLPAGEAGAHQLINEADASFEFLCFSTMQEPDVSVYPDSGKIGVFAGSAPGGDREERTLTAFLPLSAGVGYWEGE